MVRQKFAHVFVELCTKSQKEGLDPSVSKMKTVGFSYKENR